MGLFDRLRTQIENALARGTVPPTPREEAADLERSLVDMKLGLDDLRRSRERTAKELADQRTQLADAERRGELAAGIQDAETVRVAGEFATAQRVRVAVLERKLGVQDDEVAMAEQDVAELLARLKQARQGLDAGGRSPSTEAAWRSLEAAGNTRPETDVEQELLKSKADRAAMEQAADAQLAHLKKKLGKE
ncbi:MAG TPA: hypothetical protein VFI13_08350 [Gemmatimonadales bacterium]|nr:hypothetical protein [Gemmatimonadales bacterium]